MHPVPDADEMRDNATFAAVLAALSRPGSLQVLPEPGPVGIALALIDSECQVWAEDPALGAILQQTGARMAPLPEAGHVFLSLADAAGVSRLPDLTSGTPLYPDEGATVISKARFGTGLPLRLSGPGIDGDLVVHLAGLHPGLWETRAALCRYPLGIEVLLLEGARLMALPRSTLVEVL